jgi:uncharacterized Fe-S cluster-containing protein
MLGPCHRIDGTSDVEFEDIGVCMVGGFVGLVDGCMMQKVHSGVVVQMESDRAIIEGIDLKVWAPPEIKDDD